MAKGRYGNFRLEIFDLELEDGNLVQKNNRIKIEGQLKPIKHAITLPSIIDWQ